MPPRLPLPLTRANPIYPGQFGVPGTDEDTGLRVHPTGRVFYVDPNYPGADDERDGTNPTAPLLTVAEAIDLCRPYRYDTIMVSTNSMWLYAEGGQGVATAQYTTPIREEVTVDVSGVRIVGASYGPLGVPWNPASNAGTCITVSACDVVIEGFSFDDGPYATCNAIYSEWDTDTLGDNLAVRHCHFTDSVQIAIQLEFVWACDIHDNMFQGCPRGIYDAAAPANGVAYSKIHDNWFRGCMTGAISLRRGEYNAIFRNYLYNVDAEAGNACPDEGIDLAGGGANMVFDNYLSCARGTGVNGDFGNFCSGTASDAWVNNHCTNGDTTITP